MNKISPNLDRFCSNIKCRNYRNSQIVADVSSISGVHYRREALITSRPITYKNLHVYTFSITTLTIPHVLTS